jgi:hypothetical protein
MVSELLVSTGSEDSLLKAIARWYGSDVEEFKIDLSTGEVFKNGKRLDLVQVAKKGRRYRFEMVR